MSSVRINKISVNISEEMKHYKTGNTLYAEGKKQGEVFAMRDFVDDVYSQTQFKKNLELTVPLPTELLKKDNVNYDKIAQDIIDGLGVQEKYGINNVAYYVHFRDETSGRTKKDNLHVHISYIDRTIETENGVKLYPPKKRPYGLNLISGTNIKQGAFNESSIHHFKIELDTPKLDFSLVDVKSLDELKKLTSNGRKKKFTDEEINAIEVVKAEIINQAQSKSDGVVVYSNRVESKDTDKTQLKQITKSQRENVRDVLNAVIDEYNLTETLDKYGRYDALTKAEKLEIRKQEFRNQCELSFHQMMDFWVGLKEQGFFSDLQDWQVMEQVGYEFDDAKGAWKEFEPPKDFGVRYLNLTKDIGLAILRTDIEINKELLLEQLGDVIESAPPLTAKTVMGSQTTQDVDNSHNMEM